MLTSVSNRFIGEIKFDAVTSEDHRAELSITENPIESGAAIADHAFVKPKSVTINGIMVEHDHASSPLETLGFPYIRGVTNFLNHLPLPIPIVTQTAQTIARANRVISQVSGIREQVANVLDSARAIAPWLPDFNLGGLTDTSGNNRLKKCYADLLECQKSGEPIDIQTGIYLYKNMLIESIAVNQSLDGSATFTISTREIFIVETQTVATAKSNKGKSTPSGKNKSGRAATQSASKTQRGNVQLGKAKAESGENGKRSSALYKIALG